MFVNSYVLFFVNSCVRAEQKHLSRETNLFILYVLNICGTYLILVIKFTHYKTKLCFFGLIALCCNFRFLIGQYVTVHGDVISHVNISRVAVEDGGVYTCTVNNRAGYDQHSAMLNIYGKFTLA